jgi:leader peptidase (prepilin peptidase)/N-methyltransferase
MSISILIAIIIGLAAGVLINYLADVLPETRKLTKPVCTACKKPFSWFDYILYKPCSDCLKKRSLRYPCILIIITTLAGLTWIFPPTIGFWVGILIITYFGLVIVIDMEHRLVMHPVSIAGVLIGLVIGSWKHGVLMTLIGGIAGFVMMLTLYYVGIWFVRLLSRKRSMGGVIEAIGFGDVILSGVMGLFLGWPGLLAGLLLTIVLGGLVSLVILLVQLVRRKYQAYSSIPYAPFIALATMALLMLARSG